MKKIRVNPCSFVVNFSYFTQYDIRITQYGSIKIERLCETKPIFGKPKMNLTLYSTMTNNKKQRTMNYSKQSQTNPIYSVFIRVHSWLISKQTQSNPIYSVFIRVHSWLNSKQTQTKPNFGLFNFSVFPYNRAIDRI
jgi:hypothetical protein